MDRDLKCPPVICCVYVGPHTHIWSSTRVADIVPLGVHGEDPPQIRVLDQTKDFAHGGTVANCVRPILLGLALDVRNLDLLLTELTRIL